MKIGSEAHKELFCRSLIDSYIDYEPETLPWPDLDGSDLERLRQIPFWEEALNTELAAGAKVETFTKTITDPLIREAVDLQGHEEARHGRLFRHMIQRYGIETPGNVPTPRLHPIEPAFVEFGYGECLDAFLGFGMFKIARQARFLPDSVFNIFDLLLQEEARHIVFFVNWVAYIQVQRGRGARPLRAATSLWHYGRAVKGLIGLVSQSAERSENDFAATEASVFLDGFSVDRLISECLAENERRMSQFDPQLLQPKLLPGIAQVALSTMRLLPKRSPHPEEKVAS